LACSIEAQVSHRTLEQFAEPDVKGSITVNAGDKSVTVEGDPLEILDKAKQKILEG